MPEERDEQDSPHAACHGCGGTGRVNKPRLFVAQETGESFTVLESGKCPYCWDDPGNLPGIIPPA